MTHIRAMTIGLDKQAAATLTQAARTADPATAKTLSDFCAAALTSLAERIEHYWRKYRELDPDSCDLPDDVPQHWARLQDLWELGGELSAYCDIQWLRLPTLFQRIRQLGIIAMGMRPGEFEDLIEEEITSGGEIEVPIPVIWTPGD